MKLFNLDLHVSIIEDIKSILRPMGHQVDNWSLSGHCWVFGEKRATVDIVNENTWKKLDANMCEEFYNLYKETLQGYDGFIAAYPPAFALLYKKFDKPIYTVAATRYEAPFTGDNEKWDWLNQELVAMIDSGQLIPIANNRYDQLYCERFTNRNWNYVPSVCDYTNATYNPLDGKGCVIASRRNYNIDDCKHISSLGRHSWKDLYSHKAIIHIPYNVSIMSAFEQYAANVPLLFPTIRFGRMLPDYLSELMFEGNSRVHPDLCSDKMLSFGDFYNKDAMPHVILYDSFEEIPELLSSVDLKEVSNNMKEFNVKKKNMVTKEWEKLLC